MFVTHLALLVGMALPLWLSSCLADRAICPARSLVSSSGLISLGLGDTAASVVGVLLPGRLRPLAGSRKTVEGMLAGAAAMACGCAAVLMFAAAEGGGRGALLADVPARVAWATLSAAVLEAVTAQLDNLVVPVYYAAHLLMALGVCVRATSA